MMNALNRVLLLVVCLMLGIPQAHAERTPTRTMAPRTTAQPTVCTATLEICDGLDNDCDNLIDEELIDVDKDGICDEIDKEVKKPLHPSLTDLKKASSTADTSKKILAFEAKQATPSKETPGSKLAEGKTKMIEEQKKQKEEEKKALIEMKKKVVEERKKETVPVSRICGDGIKGGGEECDGADGIVKGQKCTPICTVVKPEAVSVCGDGKKNGTEQCDGRSGVSASQTCTRDCKIASSGTGSGTGPGFRCSEPGKQRTASVGCDGATMTLTCQANGYEDKSIPIQGACPPQGKRCGNGLKESGEECDGAQGFHINPNMVCNDSCQFVEKIQSQARCGDSKKDPGEECDGKAGLSKGQSCRQCKIEEKAGYCGDGVKDEGEACDKTAGVMPGQICAKDCTLHGENTTAKMLEDYQCPASGEPVVLKCLQGSANQAAGECARCTTRDNEILAVTGEACNNISWAQSTGPQNALHHPVRAEVSIGNKRFQATDEAVYQKDENGISVLYKIEWKAGVANMTVVDGKIVLQLRDADSALTIDPETRELGGAEPLPEMQASEAPEPFNLGNSGRMTICARQGECTPSTELCDGVDNDCDGEVDEEIPSIEVTCEDGIFHSDSSCRNGAMRDACPENREPLCDGKDNDNDGEADEGDTCDEGRACTSDGNCNLLIGSCGNAACENNICVYHVTGALTSEGCTSNKSVCPDGSAPSEEICDGKDNDCDGETDEDIAPQITPPAPCSDESMKTHECIGGQLVEKALPDINFLSLDADCGPDPKKSDPDKPEIPDPDASGSKATGGDGGGCNLSAGSTASMPSWFGALLTVTAALAGYRRVAGNR